MSILRNLVFMMLCVLFLSCEKQGNSPGAEKSVFESNRFDTLILANDSLSFSFGYYGDEEGVSVLKLPANAAVCTILHANYNERLFVYKPAKDFTGIDSLQLLNVRNKTGTAATIQVDTIAVYITVVKDNFHKQLVGKWNWVSTCGGFTIGCLYPDAGNRKQIEFTYDMRYIEKQNEAPVFNCSYGFLPDLYYHSDTIHRIVFNDGTYATYIVYKADTLMITGGETWSNYVKVK